MFGAVAASGINILAGVHLDRRALLIIAVSLALGLGVSQVPDILNSLPHALKNVLESGVATGGICALVMNWFLPEEVTARRLTGAPASRAPGASGYAAFHGGRVCPASRDNVARFEAKGGPIAHFMPSSRPWARTTGRRPGTDSNLRNAAAA